MLNPSRTFFDHTVLWLQTAAARAALGAVPSSENPSALALGAVNLIFRGAEGGGLFFPHVTTMSLAAFLL